MMRYWLITLTLLLCLGSPLAFAQDTTPPAGGVEGWLTLALTILASISTIIAALLERLRRGQRNLARESETQRYLQRKATNVLIQAIEDQAHKTGDTGVKQQVYRDSLSEGDQVHDLLANQVMSAHNPQDISLAGQMRRDK